MPSPAAPATARRAAEPRSGAQAARPARADCEPRPCRIAARAGRRRRGRRHRVERGRRRSPTARRAGRARGWPPAATTSARSASRSRRLRPGRARPRPRPRRGAAAAAVAAATAADEQAAGRGRDAAGTAAAAAALGRLGRPARRDLLAELAVPGLLTRWPAPSTRAGEAGRGRSLHRAVARVDRRAACRPARRAGPAARTAAPVGDDRPRCDGASGERIAAEHDDAPAPRSTRPADRDGRPARRCGGWSGSPTGVTRPTPPASRPRWRPRGCSTPGSTPRRDATAAALAGETDGYLVPLPATQRPAGPTLADVLGARGQRPRARRSRHRGARLDRLLRDGTAPAPGRPRDRPRGRFAQGVLVGAFAQGRRRVHRRHRAGPAARRPARRVRRADRAAGVAARRGRPAASAHPRRCSTRSRGRGRAAAARRRSSRRCAQHDRAAGGAARRARTPRTPPARCSTRPSPAVAPRERALRRTAADRRLPGRSGGPMVAAAGCSVRGGRQPARRRAAAGRQRRRDGRGGAPGAARARPRRRGRGGRRAQQAAQPVRPRRPSVLADPRRGRRRRGRGEVLAEVEETEAAHRRGRARAADATAAARTPRRRRGRARPQAQRDAATASAATRSDEEQAEALRLRPLRPRGHPASLLRCPADLRWPAQPRRWTDREAPCPAEVTALHEAILAATKELSPTESSLKQSATRLTTALDRAAGPAAGGRPRPPARVGHRRRRHRGARRRRAGPRPRSRTSPSGSPPTGATRSSCSPTPSAASSRTRCSPSWPGRSTTAPSRPATWSRAWTARCGRGACRRG